MRIFLPVISAFILISIVVTAVPQAVSATQYRGGAAGPAGVGGNTGAQSPNNSQNQGPANPLQNTYPAATPVPAVKPNAGTLAQCKMDEVQTELGCMPNDPVGFVKKFYGFGLAFVGMVSLLTLMLGGYDILTSKGDPRRVNVGKSYIYSSIAGLLLAIFGYMIIRVIVVDLLKIPGFS